VQGADRTHPLHHTSDELVFEIVVEDTSELVDGDGAAST
jgi:hypothetical protein